MPSVYDYLDYRDFLRDCYEERKRSDAYFSYRYMASKTGVDPGYLVKVLQGREHIAEKTIPRFVRLLKLDTNEEAFFRALVAYNKARGPEQVKHTFRRVLELKSVARCTLDADQYEFYDKWYHSAVRAVIGLYDFNGTDYGWLAGMLDPPITVEQAKASVELLERIGLVRRDPDGLYRVTDTILSSGERWKTQAVKQFQKETIALAESALERQSPERRDISTVTFTVAEKDLDELRERIREFRSSLLALARASEDADTVFQLNVQLFPITRRGGRAV